MSKEEAIEILSTFIEQEKYISFYSHATEEECEAMQFAIDYMEEDD